MGRLRSVPVFALCAIYLFLAAGVALLSTSVYRTVGQSADRHAEERVAISYIFSQLRAGDERGGIQTASYGDGDALAIADGEYETLLYCYDGYLMELYAEKELGLSPDAGIRITPAQGLSAQLDETGLLYLELQTGEKALRATYWIQSWEVGET